MFGVFRLCFSPRPYKLNECHFMSIFFHLFFFPPCFFFHPVFFNPVFFNHSKEHSKHNLLLFFLLLLRHHCVVARCAWPCPAGVGVFHVDHQLCPVVRVVHFCRIRPNRGLCDPPHCCLEAHFDPNQWFLLHHLLHLLHPLHLLYPFHPFRPFHRRRHCRCGRCDRLPPHHRV